MTRVRVRVRVRVRERMLGFERERERESTGIRAVCDSIRLIDWFKTRTAHHS